MSVASILRKNVAVVAFVTLLLSLLTFTTQPAFAAPAGTLTINDAGGGSLPTPSGGVYDIQSNITVKPADIEAALASGAVTLWATSITVQSDIDVPNSNALTLKASGSIVVDGGVDITSQGGDLIFWSDSDGVGNGNIRLGRVGDTTQGTIVSNGGDIKFGGGTDFATGYAMGTNASVDLKPLFGIAVWGFYMNAGGGDISMRAQLGAEGSARAILLETANGGAISNELRTSGTGTISLLGDASTLSGSGSGNQWGVQFQGNFTTASGDVSIIGLGGNGASNAIGILTAGTVSITSTSGDINFEDRTSTTPNSGFLFQSGNHVLSTSGDITIQADEFRNASTTLAITANSFSINPFTDESFDADVNVGPIDGSNVASVIIGEASNSANMTLNGAVTSGDTLTVYGANVAINAATSATTANLYASSAGSQTAAVSVTNLGLFGTGSYTLTNTSNAIGTVAAGSSGSKVSSLSIYDASGGLTIGQVGALEGITATGDVLVETGSGDITLAKNIATDSTSSSAITLNAGDSTAAGTSTGGNIVVSGSPTLTTGANGIVRLFSGSESDSTGLTTLAGGSSNVYYGVDETSTLSPSLSAGTSYALYRAYETCSPSEASVTSGGVAYKVLAFKNDTLCDWSVPTGVTSVDVLAVGGGGAGGGLGGGGAGEFVEKLGVSVSGSLSVVAGEGGTSASSSSSGNGSASSFGGITAAGGGGSGVDAHGAAGTDGASGGGGSRGSQTGGASVDDSDADSFGNDGGNGWGRRNPTVGGGGGGAGAAALDVVVANAVTVDTGSGTGQSYTGTYPGGDAGVTAEGGAGKSASFISSATATALSVGEVSGANVYFAGGGGGGCGGTGSNSGCTNSQLSGGVGGGGDGTTSGSPGAGTASTGGGGGGFNSRSAAGGAGGTGVVLIRYVVPEAGGSGSSSGSSQTASAEATVIAPVVPSVAPRQPRLNPLTLNTSPVPRPVERLGLVFDPDAPSRATVGGVPTNLVKTPVGSKDLSIAAGAFQFGVSLAEADGAEVQTDTPSRSPELFVPRGQSAAVSGKGSYPGSFVQLFLPGNGNDSRELARIPVRSDGTFASDLSFEAGALELPVPIGRQVLQVVGYDELGNQTVVDMTVNIGQGVPAPEPNRQVGALPALTAGQSLATSGGIPETVAVTGVPETGNVVVEGSGWVISVNADRDNGTVENADGNVLVRLNPSSVGTTFGNGFLPGTLATVWLFSEPTLMTTVTVDENGEFSAEFLVDARLIAPGEHTLQVQGVGSDGYIKAANLGVLVEEPVEFTAESASGLLWWIIGFFVLALLLFFFLLARRRRREA